MRETHAVLRQWEHNNGARVVPGHDPRVLAMFEGVAEEGVDLDSPLE
jgi:hypothetical protein